MFNQCAPGISARSTRYGSIRVGRHYGILQAFKATDFPGEALHLVIITLILVPLPLSDSPAAVLLHAKLHLSTLGLPPEHRPE